MRIGTLSGLTVVVACGLVLGLLSNLGRAQKTQTPETRYLIESLQWSALYTAYCAVCHGADGKGGGPMAKSLKVIAPDLTGVAVRNGGSFPLVRVQRIISGEELLPAGHGTRPMPFWGPVFSQISWDQDLGRMRIYNLAKYIEGLQSRK
jgi:mono/diheme cytochrome c family protein